MNYTRATVDELAIVEQLFEDVMSYEDANEKFSVFQRGVYPTTEILREAIVDGVVFILWGDDSEPHGCIVADEKEPEEYEGLPWTPGKTLVIHMLAISPAHYGKGYGSQMVRYTMDYAKKVGYVSVKLDTGGQNKPAQYLYGTKLGFRTVANRSMNVGGVIEHKEHFFYEYVL